MRITSTIITKNRQAHRILSQEYHEQHRYDSPVETAVPAPTPFLVRAELEVMMLHVFFVPSLSLSESSRLKRRQLKKLSAVSERRRWVRANWRAHCSRAPKSFLEEKFEATIKLMLIGRQMEKIGAPPEIAAVMMKAAYRIQHAT